MTHMVDCVLYKVVNVTRREREGRNEGWREGIFECVVGPTRGLTRSTYISPLTRAHPSLLGFPLFVRVLGMMGGII